jgi:hypothetical protein
MVVCYFILGLVEAPVIHVENSMYWHQKRRRLLLLGPAPVPSTSHIIAGKVGLVLGSTIFVPTVASLLKMSVP